MITLAIIAFIKYRRSLKTFFNSFYPLFKEGDSTWMKTHSHCKKQNKELKRIDLK
jgi:hypothetical protein